MWCTFLKGLTSFDNVERIFPTQQRDVARIVDALRLNDNVKSITIFGSSVTSACNPWSDIDTYLELVRDERVQLPKLENPIDLWTNFEVDDRLRREIEETGVVVFERPTHYIQNRNGNWG